MPAIAMIEFGEDGDNLHRGILIPLPSELASSHQRDVYRKAKLGWSACQLGYSFYKFAVLGRQFVFPGIKLAGAPKPRRVFPGYQTSYDAKAIEALASEIVAQADQIDEKASELVSKLTHDLRKVSSQIINSLELLKTNLAEGQTSRVRDQAEDIAAAQQVLSFRLDMMDYTTGLAFDTPHEAIPVYKKFDKIVKMFTASAAVSEVTMRLDGPSQGYTMGPSIFELIPFVLLENAVKYSPKRGHIEIKITDFPDRVDAHVRSFGPEIRGDEIKQVFDHGYRGKSAMLSGKSGSGIGLHAAYSLAVNSFGGTLTVHQSAAALRMDGQQVWGTTFSLSVPRVS